MCACTCVGVYLCFNFDELCMLMSRATQNENVRVCMYVCVCVCIYVILCTFVLTLVATQRENSSCRGKSSCRGRWRRGEQGAMEAL